MKAPVLSFAFCVTLHGKTEPVLSPLVRGAVAERRLRGSHAKEKPERDQGGVKAPVLSFAVCVTLHGKTGPVLAPLVRGAVAERRLRGSHAKERDKRKETLG